MNQLISGNKTVEMSPEEIELFQSFRSNISQSFQFSKKINDAINNQEKYLRTVKVQVPAEES